MAVPKKTAKPTGLAMRFNEGKPQLSFVLDMPYAMKYFANQSQAGAVKYDLLNWRKGLPRREIIDSLLRHLEAYANGEEIDRDGLPHLGGIVWNAWVLAEMHHRHPDLDDRFGKLNDVKRKRGA